MTTFIYDCTCENENPGAGEPTTLECKLRLEDKGGTPSGGQWFSEGKHPDIMFSTRNGKWGKSVNQATLESDPPKPANRIIMYFKTPTSGTLIGDGLARGFIVNWKLAPH